MIDKKNRREKLKSSTQHKTDNLNLSSIVSKNRSPRQAIWTRGIFGKPLPKQVKNTQSFTSVLTSASRLNTAISHHGEMIEVLVI